MFFFCFVLNCQLYSFAIEVLVFSRFQLIGFLNFLFLFGRGKEGAAANEIRKILLVYLFVALLIDRLSCCHLNGIGINSTMCLCGVVGIRFAQFSYFSKLNFCFTIETRGSSVFFFFLVFENVLFTKKK